MSIRKTAIRKLEKKVFGNSGYIVIPIYSTPDQVAAIREEAKKQGKRTMGIPLCETRKEIPIVFRDFSQPSLGESS